MDFAKLIKALTDSTIKDEVTKDVADLKAIVADVLKIIADVKAITEQVAALKA